MGVLRSGRMRPGLAVLALTILAKVTVTVKRNDIIIRFGVKTYRNLNMFLTLLLAVQVILFLIFLVKKTMQRKEDVKWKTEQAEKEKKEKEEQARLSVRKKLDSDEMKEMLYNKMQCIEWNLFYSRLKTCKEQLSEMDKHQRNLEKLLQNNGVETLSDTKDVLDQVEQYLCKNIRKVLNFLEIANPSKKEDADKVKQQLDDCIADGEEKLEQVKQFLNAVVEYLNHQDDGDEAIKMMDLYKNTILEVLQEK